MLWPIAIWAIRDRVKLLWTAGGISVLALLLRCLMVWMTGPRTAEVWVVRTLPFRMDSLLIGGMLALLLRGPNADKWQRLGRPVFLIFAAATLAIFALSPAYDSPWLNTIGLTFISMAGAGLIAMTLRAGSPAFKVFYQKPLRILGKYSYGFYIIHVIFGFAWIHFLGITNDLTNSRAIGGVIALSTNFVVTFIVSKLSFDLFEVKFLRLKRHFEYDSEQAEHKHAFTTK